MPHSRRDGVCEPERRGLVHIARACFIASVAALAAGCAGLPSLEGRTETSAITDTAGTRLGRAIAPGAASHPGKSGIHSLPVPSDAFAARILLARAADRTLDVQYYIWHGDQAGYLLFEALWEAAGRGARVRLLLDDNGTSGLDETIAALDAHPNIEVRLYNPLAHRNFRALNFVTDFERVNRRMHNKSFTADSQATIVGGRNIGNEYAGAGQGVLFADLDVIAVGSVVGEVSKAFDLYWNSRSAYPSASLLAPADAEAGSRLESRFAATRADPVAVDYVEIMRATKLLQDLLGGTLQLEWTDARVLRDDPAKTLDTEGKRELLLLNDVLATVGPPEKSFDLVSPYFVPGEKGTADLGAMARRGVAVRILTNSLAATDVSAVHAGYAKRRGELVSSGVQLYELKPTAEGGKPEGKRKTGGSSSASLHAKTFALDRRRIFVGSFNFDPRSARLNTELGFVIDCPAVAQAITDGFANSLARRAYEVRLGAAGSLQWVEQRDGETLVHDAEPGTDLWQRLGVSLLSLMPIEWLL
jgi:putative cardiolipin synthase